VSVWEQATLVPEGARGDFGPLTDSVKAEMRASAHKRLSRYFTGSALSYAEQRVEVAIRNQDGDDLGRAQSFTVESLHVTSVDAEGDTAKVKGRVITSAVWAEPTPPFHDEGRSEARFTATLARHGNGWLVSEYGETQMHGP